MAFDAVFYLRTLDGTNGFRLIGDSSYDYSGRSVAGAGDINGDGFDDLIVGFGDGPGSGVTHVVFGKSGGFPPLFELAAINGTDGFFIYGGYGNTSVASAGDVNGDGFDDLIVGDEYAGGSSGASYVVFGKAGGFGLVVDVGDLDGTIGFQINGEAAGDESGKSVASAGDINGDGFDDLIIGAPDATVDSSRRGASYVVFGKASGFEPDVDLGSLDGSNGFQISGETLSGNSGYSVAGAGDINGDGFDDLIVGDPSSNASYVVFGRASGFSAEIKLADLDGANGVRIGGEATGDKTGISVASAGDVNGDGLGDLIVGAKDADPKGDRSGASYVLFGRRGGFEADIDLAMLDGTNGFQISGAAAADYSGFSVAGAGDVNGDGFDDLIIGAYGANDGASYVLFGKAGGFTPDINLSALDGSNGFQIIGERDLSGYSVDGAGDVNGDGFDDLIIGAPGADLNGNLSGASYVIFGQATGAIARVGTDVGDFFAGGDFNDRLNGEGGDDRLVGNGGDDRLLGKAGGDSLDGGRGNDRLFGGGADDLLIGRYGDDLLDGGHESDRLKGGAGNDTFVFKPGDDEDRVLDFTDVNGSEDDFIDVSAYGFSSFAEISVRASGDDAILDLGSGDTIRLKDYLVGHTFSDLAADDFLL